MENKKVKKIEELSWNKLGILTELNNQFFQSTIC